MIQINLTQQSKANFTLIPLHSLSDLPNIFKDTQLSNIQKKLGILAVNEEPNSVNVICDIQTDQTYIFCFVGEKGIFTTEKLRKSLGKGLKLANKLKAVELNINFAALENSAISHIDMAKIAAEVAQMALYKFDDYKSDAEKLNLNTVHILMDEHKSVLDAINEGKILGESTILARQMVNEPAIYMYPETLATVTKELGEKHGFEVEVLNEDECLALGMHAFLAVGAASNKAPRLIVMRYKNGSNKEENIGLIGKGVTYDTGGLSLKPTGSMLHMKSDMSGAAITIASMTAIARMKVQRNVTAVVAACENAVAGNAYKPGDILQSMAGKTIEINNTDAEGRLTLADAITYAIEKEKVSHIIDSATLTGAVKVALGNHTAGAVSTSDELVNALQTAITKSDEKFWRLPIDDEYRELNKSDFADIANTGSAGLAGTITAAAFVEFFNQGKPWLHLDIAGVSFKKEESEYVSKGGTGFGVRSLYYLVNALD